MTITRRRMLVSVLAAPAVIASTRLASTAPVRTLKLTHPFRMSADDGGDMRDRLCRQFAVAVETRTGGELAVEIASDFAVRDTVGIFSALRKGTLDLSLYPISDAGQEFPELDIGLMPGLVTSYKQGAAWKTSPVSRKFSDFLADKGIVVLSFIWLAGGMASRVHPIVNPEDAKGLKIRSGHHQMDEVLHAVGAVTTPVRTNVLYASMSGALDAAVTTRPASWVSPGRGCQKRPPTSRFTGTSWRRSSCRSRPTRFSSHQDTLRSAPRSNSSPSRPRLRRPEGRGPLHGHGVSWSISTSRPSTRGRALARSTTWKRYAEKTPLSAELIRLAEAVT